MRNADRTSSTILSRREVFALGIGAFVVASIPLAARRRHELVRRTVPVMGTIAELAVVHRDPRQAHAAIDDGIEELRRVERVMTRFSETSDVGRANRLAATRPVAVTGETVTVLREALGWAEASAGSFDPCFGRATRLWDVTHRRIPPAEQAVLALAERRLYRALDLGTTPGGGRLRFADPDVEIDLGGIAKGYGVDRAVDALRRRGIAQAIVNVGGDLYAMGGAADGEPWRVGIRAPEEGEERLADEILVADAAIATSGDYLQYFSHGGRRYHHLLDPATGAPRRTPVHSLTMKAATCLEADAGATALFGLPPERAEQVLSARAPGTSIVSVIQSEA